MQGITGLLFIGMDPHALSEPALASAIEVFAANGQEIMVDNRLRGGTSGAETGRGAGGLQGEKVVAKLTRAPFNDAPIGG